MDLNDERNIVLKAFYYDLDKGNRISSDRVVSHLKTTIIDPNRIHFVLDDLQKEGYIEPIPAFNEYKITQKGERLIEEHGGFGNWKSQLSIVNNINTGGGNVVGNAIGNQSLGGDFLLGNNIANRVDVTTPPNIEVNAAASTQAPKTLIGKIWAWIDENKIISVIIGGLFVSYITYAYIIPYIEKKSTPKQNQTTPKKELSTPKK